MKKLSRNAVTIFLFTYSIFPDSIWRICKHKNCEMLKNTACKWKNCHKISWQFFHFHTVFFSVLNFLKKKLSQHSLKNNNIIFQCPTAVIRGIRERAWRSREKKPERKQIYQPATKKYFVVAHCLQIQGGVCFWVEGRRAHPCEVFCNTVRRSDVEWSDGQGRPGQAGS